MKRLIPELERGGKRVTNYRGHSVPTGLGIVWLVWAASVASALAIANALAFALTARLGPFADRALGSAISEGPIAAVGRAAPALLLVAGAAAFGMVDDVFGDASARGFRGHLAALAHGRMTTGGLKLLGIGGLSLAASLHLGMLAFAEAPRIGLMPDLAGIATWLLAALVIALSANLVNLADLRPGRALKTYALLAMFGMLFGAWATWAGGDASSLTIAVVRIGGFKLSALALLFGPLLAVWRYDLGERAMLGDAGANAAGALAGFILAWQSPLWLLLVLAVLLLALNLVSERVSFSGVIERVAFLRWLDGLGRLPADEVLAAEAPTGALSVKASDSEDGE
jgi:hypothetical protein